MKEDKNFCLIDEKGNLKQNINIYPSEKLVEAITYVDNLRICDVFDCYGNWSEFKIWQVRYTDDYKIEEIIFSKKEE